MKVLCTEIEIKAPAGKVWRVLTGFGKYQVWNPFFFKASGTAQEDEWVDASFHTNERVMTIHSRVVKAEPNVQLIWRYHIGLPFLWQGEHSFTIVPLGRNRIRLVNQEIFTGLLIPLMVKEIDTNTRQGFEDMNKALKVRAEHRRRLR
jgi:hypothetical protein